jgi:DNA helicase-2/ATP-dependent DNA helicase PcrA
MTAPSHERAPGAERDEELERIVAEEEKTLSRVQKAIQNRAKRDEFASSHDYDAQLLALRDQINEARLEDVPPLIEEMERLTEVAARRNKVVEGMVDPDSPYFGRLVLEEGERKREVLIGKATYIDPKSNTRIVDWRDAPVSRIYYRHDEGDEYDENFGGRDVQGEVLVRRSVAIGSRLLRRIGCPQGIFLRTRDATWRRAGDSSRLKGGQGAAMRAEGHHGPAGAPAGSPASRGRLGIGADDGRDEKFLPEITALIDARQFELITKPDAGLVVIQGGAGSGKTTIGLHRLAYLAFHDPKRFRSDRMLVMVFNEALVRYISRVLPALGVNGVPVTTFATWAEKLRKGHLKGLPDTYETDTPASVTRFKKHQAMLRLVDALVTDVAGQLERRLAAALHGIEAGDQAMAFWAENDRAPLLVRLGRLERWAAPELEGDDEGERPIPKGPRPIALRHAIERTVKAARRELLDVSSAWAEMLTDEARVRRVFAEHAPELDDDDLKTALGWCADRCARVLAELEVHRDEDAPKEKEPKAAKGKKDDGEGDDPSLRFVDGEEPKPKLVVRRRASDEDDDDDDDDDRSVGIDGAVEVEPARLDREDDAILLRLVQRLRGPLVKNKERIRYEHILIDEAQDLSPVEMAVVLGASTKDRSVTLSGDVAQRLHMDNGFKSWEQLLSAVRTRRPGQKESTLAPIEVEPLKVQYRSTHPIIELAQAVLGPLADPKSGNAIRDGAPVELFRFAHSGEAVGFLGEALRELMQAEPRASVAVIARHPEQADIYFKGLKTAEVPHLRRIAEQDFPFKPGIDVTDVRQVKGLEFDYVILLEVSRSVFSLTDEARHLLHIAATRAAHQLWVTCTGEPSDLLPQELKDRAF